MKHKINKKLLNKQIGFVWESRYSDANQTDSFGRWAAIAYYNGFCIAWVNGYVFGKHEKLDNRRTGTVDFFIVNLYFPTSSQQFGGNMTFNAFEDCKKYVEEMFIDFKKLIQ